MAEIPIEKKSGLGWLWLLLAAIVLGLLAWWLLDDDSADGVEYTDNDTAMTAPMTDPMNPDGTAADAALADAATSNAAISNAGMAAGAGAAMAIGEAVDLENVRVTSLAGDMAFYIDANGRKAFVVFDETPGRIKETQFDIDPGMILDIEGDVRAASDPMPAGIKASVPSGTDQYIVARKISPRK